MPDENIIEVPKTATLEEILGVVATADAKVVGKPKANNTRWIFDLSLSTHDRILGVSLLDWRSRRKIYPDIMSWSISPLNPAAHDAKPCGEHNTETGDFIIRVLEIPGVKNMRVSIDVLHSAHR